MEVMIDSLPGFPDGVSLAEDGNFWITLVAPKQPFVKVLPYRSAPLRHFIFASTFCSATLAQLSQAESGSHCELGNHSIPLNVAALCQPLPDSCSTAVHQLLNLLHICAAAT